MDVFEISQGLIVITLPSSIVLLPVVNYVLSFWIGSLILRFIVTILKSIPFL